MHLGSNSFRLLPWHFVRLLSWIFVLSGCCVPTTLPPTHSLSPWSTCISGLIDFATKCEMCRKRATMTSPLTFHLPTGGPRIMSRAKGSLSGGPNWGSFLFEVFDCRYLVNKYWQNQWLIERTTGPLGTNFDNAATWSAVCPESKVRSPDISPSLLTDLPSAIRAITLLSPMWINHNYRKQSSLQ